MKNYCQVNRETEINSVQLCRSDQTNSHSIMESQKSPWMAFIAAFFFGPIGLMYASVTQGVVGLLLAVAFAFTGPFAIPLMIALWIGCCLSAPSIVKKQNKQVREKAELEERRHQEILQATRNSGVTHQ